MRHGTLESVVLTLLLLRPFRCESCNNRYYSWFFSKRGARQVTDVPRKTVGTYAAPANGTITQGGHKTHH
jgi:hypothetical protein